MSKNTIAVRFSSEEERDKFVDTYRENDNYRSYYIESHDYGDEHVAILEKDQVEDLATLRDDITLSGGKPDLNY